MLEGAVAAKDSADVSLTAARDENSRLSQQLAQLETTLAHKVQLLPLFTLSVLVSALLAMLCLL
jgi:hypothetical protein